MNWFRKKSWTSEDKIHFFSKLKRAREYNRAQYIRVQAVELIETNKIELLEVAESLLIKMLTEYPDDKFNRASAFDSLGDIYKKQNKLEKAISYYKKALDFENEYPSVKTQSYLSYAELIVKNKMTDKFDVVKTVILERFDTILFPIEKYKAASILSIIYKKEQLDNLALKYSEIAEQHANKETSGLRYHSDLGIVTKRLSWLDKLVKRK